MFIEMMCWEISLIVRNIELLHISHASAFFSKFSFYFNKFVEHLLCPGGLQGLECGRNVFKSCSQIKKLVV